MVTTRMKNFCFGAHVGALAISLTVVTGGLGYPAMAEVQHKLSEKQATEIAADGIVRVNCLEPPGEDP